MKHLIITAALALAPPPVWAQCDIPDPHASAAGWTVTLEDPEWIAEHPDYPGLKVELFMHAPEPPMVLEWTVHPRYGNRIGVLQHYAGEPGTSYLVTILSNVIVDLETGETLGEATASEDCEPVSWEWHEDRIVVDDPGYGEVVIMLP